ncbi:MAG TPA: BrnA antitoxin family protein [Rhizomicrobium sp.]
MARKPKYKDDPDNLELTDADFRNARPFLEVFPEFADAVKRLRGRPRAEHPKVQVTLRLDPDVVSAFKEEGRGWQGRINETLVRAVKRRRAK